MSGLKVALVSTKVDWHGGEEQAWQLALGLRNRGHMCHLLARRSSEIARRMADAGFAVQTFNGRGRGPADIWRLRRHLTTLRPDVLHLNDSHALTGAGLAALGLKIPARVAARRVDFALNSPWQYRLLADRVICVSHDVARVCAQGGIPRDRLCVVHDGVDPHRMAGGVRRRGRSTLGIGDGRPLLLTVARLTDHKGHRYLMEALPGVLARHPTACLALAGNGELRETLQQQARELGVEHNVRFLGYRRDLPHLLAACDLFVMPSHMEGLCSSLIDVMYARRPIVATLAGGIPELLGHAAADEEPVAYLVPPRDPAALADAICQALASPQRTATMTRRAYERSRARFTVDCMVEATLAVYRELVRGEEVPVPDFAGLTKAA
jgi:glycosyltransferase involved in cell wall biosynthesis